MISRKKEIKKVWCFFFVVFCMAADGGEVAHIVQSVSRFLGDVNKKSSCPWKKKLELGR